MTDRHSGYVVVLAQDIREDDAEPLINALRMLKGVAEVHPLSTMDAQPAAFIVERRTAEPIRTALLKLAGEI